MNNRQRRRWVWSVIALVVVACAADYLLSRRGQAPPLEGKSRRTITADSDQSGRRALLVGCGRYLHPSIPPLEGPRNDVRLMKEVLVRHCGFSPEDIVTLAGEPHAADAPTRANIEREFRRLRVAAQTNDQIVVLLAGHGSQQPNQAANLDDLEPDGLDEIFLPIDAQQWSSTSGSDASGGVANAIVDDDIHRWTAAIADKGASLWIIFDCCCAGTAIRGEFQEVPRFVSAADDLKIPETSLVGTDDRPAAENNESYWELNQSLPDEEDRVGQIVAFYACQAHESEPELTLPPARNDANVARAKHGLLAYALCCSLSQAAGDTLTYRDVARDVWLRYRSWGRTAPTPFADGDLDRQVFGQRHISRRFRVVRRSGREAVIDAGALEGLTPGSIVALYSSATAAAKGNDRPTGYARVSHVQPTTARIVPCAYGDVAEAVRLDVGACGELAYADFGDLRLTLAIDQNSAAAGQQAAVLASLAAQLRALADAPAAVFTLVDEPSSADWVIRTHPSTVEKFTAEKPTAEKSVLELLPKSAAGLAEGEPLPPGTPRFGIEESHSADTIAKLLQRVFRAQNLMKLAGASVNARTPRNMKLKMELLSDSVPLADGAMLNPGQKVEWKITNEAAVAIDLTLLFIDSEWSIFPAFPKQGELAGNNRLAPGKCLCQEATVTAETLGAEYLVAVAARARGPQRDFRFLAEPSLDAAQHLVAAVRGDGEDVLQSPFGRLLRYALYNDESLPGATRGLSSADADDCRLALRAWVVTKRGQE